jgi:hypothetical protein
LSSVTLDALKTHLDLMADSEIQADYLSCMRPLLSDPEERALLDAYARSRPRRPTRRRRSERRR